MTFGALIGTVLLAVAETWYDDSLTKGFQAVEPLPVHDDFKVQPSTGRHRLGVKSDDGLRTCYTWASWQLRGADLSGKTLCVAFRARGEGTAAIETDAFAPQVGFYHHGSQLLPYRDMPFRAFFGPFPSNQTDNVGIHLKVDGHMEAETPLFLVRSGELELPPTNPDVAHDPELSKRYFVGRSLPMPEGEADLAQRAEVYSLGLLPSRLSMATDGSLGTRELNPFVIEFPHMVQVTAFRWTLPGRAMELYADTDGDGTFETDVYRTWSGPEFSTWKDLRDYVWLVKRFKKPFTLRRLLVVGGAREFQLLGAKTIFDALPAPCRYHPSPVTLEVGDRLARQPPEPTDECRLWYGFCLEPWMFGIQNHMVRYFDKGIEPPPLAEWDEWKEIAADFHSLYANFVLLFPPNTCIMPPGVEARPGSDYPTPLLWPSEVWYVNQPFDFLAQFNDACHKEGFLDFVIPRGWDFITNRTEEVKQVTLAREIAVRGSDGVPVCVDEHQFYMPLDFTKDASLLKDFCRWSGQTNRPARAFYADDLATRLGYLYSIKRKADWMASIKREQERVAPKALTFGGFGGCDYWQIRHQVVSGADYWGWEGKCDVIGGDGTYFGVGVESQGANLGTLTPALQTAVQVSCTPKRLSLATVNFNWGMRWDAAEGRLRNPLVYDDFPNVAHTGGALATYFNKGTYLDYWRYNFMDLKGPATRKAVKAGGCMTRVLGAWGGRQADIPRDVLVLRSRPSEDWWSLRFSYNAPETGMQTDRIRHWGHHLFFWMAARLAEAATPFEIYQLQRVDAWKERADTYKAIVLPFAYAVSDEEAAALRDAAEKGAKIVLLGGKEAGTVDGLGERRKTNAFADIPVIRFEIADANVLSTFALAESFTAQMKGVLGVPSLAIDKPRGHDVQSYLLSVSTREKLLMVANWSERDTSANLHVSLPPGDYAVEVCDDEGVRSARIGGKLLFGPKEAADFRVDLKREETLLIRFFVEQNGKQKEKE